jgi:hypothetical protein
MSVTTGKLSAQGLDVSYRQAIAPNFLTGSRSDQDTDTHDMSFQGRGKADASIVVVNLPNQNLTVTVYGAHSATAAIGDDGVMPIRSFLVAAAGTSVRRLARRFPYYIIRFQYTVAPDDAIAKAYSVYVNFMAYNGHDEPIKNVEVPLLAITNVAANAQQKSAELDLRGLKRVTVNVDIGRTATTAFVGAGTEIKVQFSQELSGNDGWIDYSMVCDITAATEIVMDALEAAGATRIECGAGLPAAGDFVYFKNATIANSEWAKVVAILSTGGSEYFDIEDGLKNEQAAITLYNKAQRFNPTFEVGSALRMRVVINNNNGSTNVAVDAQVKVTSQE